MSSNDKFNNNQNENKVNDEDILKIQDEIDNLEQKLFFDNSNLNINERNYISDLDVINISKNDFIHKEKLNEKSYKFYNNIITNNNSSDKSKIENINNNIKIIDETDCPNNNNINKEQKIKQLKELQKEIDKLRKEKGKKISKKLDKINSYNNKYKKKFNKK